MATQVDKVKARHAKELAEAEAADRILARIPPGGRVFVSDLYGRVARVSYGDEHGTPATWEQAIALAINLPPVALTMVRDGCLSFRPTSYVEALPESAKERWEQECNVSPVLAHIEGFQGPRFSLQWTAEVPTIGLVEVHVHLGHVPRGIGVYDPNKRGVRPQDKERSKYYDAAKFSAAPDLHTVYGPGYPGAGEPVAQLESPIRWASGGPEYPNRITLYFCDLGADQEACDTGRSIVEYLAHLANRKAVQS